MMMILENYLSLVDFLEFLPGLAFTGILISRLCRLSVSLFFHESLLLSGCLNQGAFFCFLAFCVQNNHMVYIYLRAILS